MQPWQRLRAELAKLDERWHGELIEANGRTLLTLGFADEPAPSVDVTRIRWPEFTASALTEKYTHPATEAARRLRAADQTVNLPTTADHTASATSSMHEEASTVAHRADREPSSDSTL